MLYNTYVNPYFAIIFLVVFYFLLIQEYGNVSGYSYLEYLEEENLKASIETNNNVKEILRIMKND
jgi:hypothetical protein